MSQKYTWLENLTLMKLSYFFLGEPLAEIILLMSMLICPTSLQITLVVLLWLLQFSAPFYSGEV